MIVSGRYNKYQSSVTILYSTRSCVGHHAACPIPVLRRGSAPNYPRTPNAAVLRGSVIRFRCGSGIRLGSIVLSDFCDAVPGNVGVPLAGRPCPSQVWPPKTRDLVANTLPNAKPPLYLRSSVGTDDTAELRRQAVLPPSPTDDLRPPSFALTRLPCLPP